MNKRVVVLLSMGMLAIVAGADTVNFTAGEGYTIPGALTYYAGWNGSTEFTVNTNGTGTVGWGGSTAGKQINCENGVAATESTVGVSIQFRMTEAGTYSSGARGVAGVALGPNTTDSAQQFDDVRAYVNRTSSTTFQLVLQNSTLGSYSPRLMGSGFSQSLMGLDGTVGDASDLLEITLVLQRGATETNWVADAFLKNVTTGAMVYQMLDYGLESPASYFEGSLYGGVLSSSTDALAGLADRQIESFAVIPDRVEFTAEEGYTIPGVLTDYAGWNGNASFTVNTNGTGTVDWSTPASMQMNYETGVAATDPTVGASIQFRFTRVAGYSGGFKVVTGLLLEKDAVGTTTTSDGLNDVRTFLQRTSADTYNVMFLNSTDGTTTDLDSYAGFNQSLLGIAANGDVSDLLELELVLHRGATETNWTADTILKNVTTDTAVFQSFNRAFESPEAYFNSTLYGAITGGGADLNSGMTTRQIESFRMISGGGLFLGALLDINVVDDYGATPVGTGDDAPAFQAAFDALEVAGGGRLFIPAGNYIFNSQVTNNTSSARLLTIQGEPGVQLYGNNSDGIFQFTYNIRGQQVNIRDLTMIAYRDNAGTAIEITSPPGGVQEKRVVTIENVHMRPQIGNANQYFTRGIVVTGVFRPLIKNCSFIRTVVSDLSDSSANFLPQVGFDVSDCYAPVIQDCTVKGAYTAFNFVTSAGSVPEDGAVINCVADYCRIGVKFHQTDGAEPTFWVTACDIKARDIGVWVKNRRICHVTDNIFRQLSLGHALVDVQFDYVHLGFVLRNLFSGNLASGRKNIVVDKDGSYIIIKDNSLSGLLKKAIQIDPAADNILCQ